MANSDTQALADGLKALKADAENKFSQSSSSQDLYNWKVHFLGKTGEITQIMKKMGELPKEERPEFGKKVNEVKVALEKVYEQAELKLKSVELQDRLNKETLDLSLPGHIRPRGTLHPVTQVTEEIVKIMARLGYSLRIGPMIEKDYYNFEALNIPADHPARDMQDTFFIDKHHVLRTHTSPIQIHTLENEELPLRIVGTGGVFRCDSDISHLPHFHQIEGMCVDRKISMADLKGTISFFVREFFGADLKIRFRPSFFPFTEPSAEVDCQCPLCGGDGVIGATQPCSMCKQTGWIEIGGSGLINPRVLQMAKVAYPEWQGFAFGFGIERMAIIKYGIDDIRLFPDNDLRFLGQFDL